MFKNNYQDNLYDNNNKNKIETMIKSLPNNEIKTFIKDHILKNNITNNHVEIIKNYCLGNKKELENIYNLYLYNNKQKQIIEKKERKESFEEILRRTENEKKF